MKIRLHSIETLGLVDGPGIRVVVFLQGCNKRCIYCHNPDTWDTNGGIEIESNELIKNILRYKSYFNEKGGVTFSGGEPLLQKDALIEVIKLCKENDIHVCLDTSGFIGNCEEIIKLVDLVILDVKAIDKEDYFEITKSSIDNYYNLLNTCQKLNKKMWLRQVIIPGYNDTVEHIHKLADFIKNLKNIEKIELLPYHNSAIYKYKELNIDYVLKDLENMDKEKTQELNELLINLLK